MKLIGIDAEHFHKVHYKKDQEGHGRFFSLVFTGIVEGICSDAKKGLKYFDEVELCIDIDINKFLSEIDTKTINHLKKELINHIKTK
tara:strand:+ start:1488 stop:1748 length:261 start_codon:yes stop_codon:yes gene_type:complete